MRLCSRNYQVVQVNSRTDSREVQGIVANLHLRAERLRRLLLDSAQDVLVSAATVEKVLDPGEYQQNDDQQNCSTPEQNPLP